MLNAHVSADSNQIHRAQWRLFIFTYQNIWALGTNTNQCVNVVSTQNILLLKLRFEIVSQKFQHDKSIVLRIVPKQTNQIVTLSTQTHGNE